MNYNPLLLADFYKMSHHGMYPEGTTKVYSNFTPRTSRIEGIDSVVCFGIQYLVKEYLMEQFQEGFFDKPKAVVINDYKRRMNTSLGPNAVSTSHLEALHDLGYLPIELKALPEGTEVPIKVPVLTITNTLPEFYWLTNYLETLLSNTLWQPMTSATIAKQYRKILDKAAAKTSDMPDFVGWQGHDFSMRGQVGVEASVASGAGHLLSFTGTDTIPAIDFLERYYRADAEKELIGGSVPATEHSIACMDGNDDETGYFTRMLNLYPTGIVSVVSDSYDYWNVLGSILPSLKDKIMARNGKLVIRPDSGDPVKILCGDPEANKTLKDYNSLEHIGTVEHLWNVFGGTVNSKGYKQLDPHIGVIYGDSITLERCQEIVNRLEAKGFASTNVVFGIGSYTYQYVTRDTFGFAMKATYGIVNGVGRDIFKSPKTDNGMKKSAKGLLRVDEVTNGLGVKRIELTDQISSKEEQEGMLETVFKDGKLVKETSLQEIRERLKNG